VLSDDVLICIFDLYRQELKDYDDIWPWHTLAHVCQRWRNVIFAWPHHLDLRLRCRSRTAATKALNVWPTLPISVHSHVSLFVYGDDIIDALEHRDRIAGIKLSQLTRSRLARCTSLLQEPFPVLRFLSLNCRAEYMPVFTDTFMGGSAPRLQKLQLCYVSFPTLPKLLLSANDLVDLLLKDITRAGYISPDTMATCLSMLKRLRFLFIGFESQNSFPNQTNRPPPPVTRALLPALAEFVFIGLSEYSEDLISRIDAPRLDYLHLLFFYRPTLDRDISQLPQFIRCIEKFKPSNAATTSVRFNHDAIVVSLSSSDGGNFLELGFRCDVSASQHSVLKQIYTQPLPLLNHAKVLVLALLPNLRLEADQQDSMIWLGFLRLFNEVQTLWVCGDVLEGYIARVLGELTGERAAEVLPMLHTLKFLGFYLVGPSLTQSLKPFIDVRQLSGRPVVVQ